MTTIPTVYTLGYSKLKPPALAAIAEGLDAIIIDIRGRPQSRQPGYGRRQLESLLGARYQWRGDTLGGIHHLANARALWPAATSQLISDMRGGLRPILMCQCYAPGDCHRHQVALVALAHPSALPIQVVHLIDEESVEARELERSMANNDDYDCFNCEAIADLRETWEGPK